MTLRSKEVSVKIALKKKELKRTEVQLERNDDHEYCGTWCDPPDKDRLPEYVCKQRQMNRFF